jgi:hypothetical protein
MNDYRAAGQELQGQVLAAARKGQERVTKSVKNMTTAAQQIRPQLANLSRPPFNISALPSPAQLREKAPEFVAKLPAKLPPGLQTRLQTRMPNPEQLRTSAQEFADHARSVQRLVADQVRSVATPLAHQAAARLAQVGGPTTATKAGSEAGTTTKVRQVTVSKASKPADTPAKPAAKPSTTSAASAKPSTASAKPSTTSAKPSTTSAKPSTTSAKPSTTAKSAKSGSTAADESSKPKTRPSSTAKPKADPADK